MSTPMIEPPSVEWHGHRPFALARLDPAYAEELESLAHELLPRVLDLPAQSWFTGHPDHSEAGARYADYNVFLLSPRLMPLFLALQETYRTLAAQTHTAFGPTYVKGWFNVTPAGGGIHRHSHRAPLISTFCAFAEGSSTRFGAASEPGEDDVAIENRDGQIMMTTGMGHFHHVDPWHREDRDRVTFAFDIVPADWWRPDRVQVPFDGPVGPA